MRPEGASTYLNGESAHADQVRQLEGALAAATGMVEGSVHRVTFKSESGYTVLKVNAVHVSGKPADPASRSVAPSSARKGSGNIVTVVGNFPHADKGQLLRFAGHWDQHAKHGTQLKAIAFEEVVPQSTDAIAAYLSSVLSGVGPVTARNMVEQYGTNILSILDSPSAAVELAKCRGIGSVNASTIKKDWDESRGTRDARAFLKKLGVGGKLAQTLVDRYGVQTETRLRQDPYSTLFSIPGVSFRAAEDLARAVEAPSNLMSRGAMAFLHTLELAADKSGHTHLPWDVLLSETLRLMSSSGKSWEDKEALQRVAQKLQERGLLVVEAPEVPMLTQASPNRGPTPTLSELFAEDSAIPVGEDWKDAAKTAAWKESLQAHLAARMTGVGPGKARQMVDEFGERILSILNSRTPAAEKQLMKLKGIGKITAARMKASWDKSKSKHPAWVNPTGGSLAAAAASDAASDAASAAGAVSDAAPVAEALSWPWPAGSRCYLASMHHAEVRVAAALVRIAAQPEQIYENNEERFKKWSKEWLRKQSMSGNAAALSEGQKAAVWKASTAPLVVLTGGPGCGKTFATKAIVQVWAQQRKDIRLAAPTGRAAQRLQDEVRSSKCRATTLHRLLGYKSRRERTSKDGASGSTDEGVGDEEGTFVYNAARPLECSSENLAVLVDEVSMLDMPLAAALLDALPTDRAVQLVLVGDADQLPPVGAGSFLAAAIESGAVPVVDLREVFRQAQGSAIVKAAHAVHAGSMPTLTRTAPHNPSQEAQESEALWVVPRSMADIEDEVVNTVSSSLLSSRGIDAKTDLQVLSPMRRGAAGVQNLNMRLQALLNPPKPDRAEISLAAATDRPQLLRVGDRVIQAVNNYEKDVYNGDPGYISEIDPKARRVIVSYPSTSSGPKSVEYVGPELWEIELAWATTVHKAQGSESKAVIVVLSPGQRPLLTRRLLYTALTRARETVIVVGPESAIRTALQDVQGDVRLTSLHSRLAAAADRAGLERCTPVVYGDGLSQGLAGAEVSQAVAKSLQQAHDATMGHGPTQGPSAGAFNHGSEAATPEVENVMQQNRAAVSRITPATSLRRTSLARRALQSSNAAGSQLGLQQGAQEWGDGGRNGKVLLRVEGEAA
ncbi:probable recBCD enzyme subunit RecD at C-terminar half [Coccomyxa sp. Obi]|nr:probable recBCD enzyme subunit RecD at C-terminar half [Coccomyxa sp. Obi]